MNRVIQHIENISNKWLFSPLLYLSIFAFSLLASDVSKLTVLAIFIVVSLLHIVLRKVYSLKVSNLRFTELAISVCGMTGMGLRFFQGWKTYALFQRIAELLSKQAESILIPAAIILCLLAFPLALQFIGLLIEIGRDCADSGED